MGHTTYWRYGIFDLKLNCSDYFEKYKMQKLSLYLLLQGPVPTRKYHAVRRWDLQFLYLR